MIPKIIHQIWVGPYRVPKREQKLMMEIKNIHSDWTHMYWTDENVKSLNMPEHIQKSYDFWVERDDYVAQADILRLFVVKKFGGIYLDIDFKVVSPNGFNDIDLLSYDAFFCYHDTDNIVETFPNGIFGSSVDSKIFSYLCDNILINSFHTPHKLATDIKKYYNVPNNIIHTGENGILEHFKRDNIFFMTWENFHNNYFFHHALYSHAIENKRKFARGDYE